MGKEEKTFNKFLRNQILLIGMLFAGDTIFSFFEQNYMNTYLDQVLDLSPLFITLLVSLSAIVGLIMNLTFGIISDNTRSKYGRRRPYLLFGTIAGVAMILYSFSINLAGGDEINAYIICIILDVIIIGTTSNAYYVSERSLIPDTVDIKRRGRANGIVNSILNVGLLVAIAAFLVSDLIFGQDIGGETVIGQTGHIFLFTIGGTAFIVAGLCGFTFIKEREISELPPKKKFKVELKDIINLEQLKSNKEFFKIILALTIYRTGFGIIMPFLFIYIFALGLSTIALLIGIVISFPILILVINLLGRLSDKYGRKKFIPISIMITSTMLFLIPFTKIDNQVNLILFYIILPFIMIITVGLDTPMNTWSQDLIPEDTRGKFFGILNIIYTIPQIIGAFIGGLVATYFVISGFIPESFIFIFAPIFFLGSIPIFLRVKETLKME